MFNLLAPGNLVLTLQSKPPFVLESAFAVVLTVLLAAPLIARVYLLLDEPLRNLAKRSGPSCRRRSRSSESLLIRYPAREVADATSSSDLRLGAAREISSTSAVRDDGDVSRSSSRPRAEDNDDDNDDDDDDQVAGKIEARRSRRRKRPSLSRPTSSSGAAARRPVDISDLDYKAHRHRLIEASLRLRYNDYQPPGDVVLNSLHLNSADSVAGVRLNDHYDHSLFDFVEEYYDVAKATSRENAGGVQPHPLDHFLVRGTRRPKTAERQTETQPEDDVDRESLAPREGARDYPPVSADGVSPRSPDVDTNGNPRVQPRNEPDSTPTRLRVLREPRESSLKEDRARRKCLRATKNRSASAGSASTLQAPRAPSRVATLPEGRGLLGSSGRGRSAGRFGGPAKKLEDQPDKSPSYGRTGGGRQKEATDLFLCSSSEIISVCSERSAGKRRDETSCRSRESSISPKSRARPPWLSGNRDRSFNRKYANIAKDSARTGRPVSTRGSSLPRKAAAPSENRWSKPARRDRTLPGLRANVNAPRGKERIGMSAEEKKEEEEKKKEEEEEEEEKKEGVTATSPGRQGHELKEEVGEGSLVTPDEEIPKPTTTSFPRKKTTSSLSSPRSWASTSRRPLASSETFAGATGGTEPRTWATRGPRLARLVPGSGKKQAAGGPKPTIIQDGRTRLIRDGGRRAAKVAPLHLKIELASQVLNPADSAKLGGHELQVVPPRESAKRMTEGDGGDVQEVLGVKNASGETTGNSSRVPRSRIPETTRRTGNSRPRPASESRQAASRGASSKSADSEPSAGSGLKLREHGALDGRARVLRKDVLERCSEEELRLPRHDSKVGLAMNSALRRYIETLKQGLLDRSDKDGVLALASLSLTDAISILSGEREPLSAEETRELQSVLSRVERNPELLLHGGSPSSVADSTA